MSEAAQHLCIRVTRNGQIRVEVSLPRRTIDWFETLIPVEAMKSIQRRGIDLSAIKSGVQERGYAPGPVFTLEEEEKRIEVWLK